ncbi:MAG: LON peptidase substrate-binding domain-containing protein, partial [Clostridia bacterium]|nr:LON peptidase substrate-binding domain-containing protein [Clostridia bacterium]
MVEEEARREGRIRELPLLPLRGVLVFPYMIIHLDVGRDKSINAIEQAMITGREILLAMQKEAQTDEPGDRDIYRMGTVAEIKQLLKLPGGTIRVLVEGIVRARIRKYVMFSPYLRVVVEELPDYQEKTPEIEALMRNLVESFEHYVKVSKKIPSEAVVSIVSLEEPGRLCDVIASHLSLKLTDRQEILEATDVRRRLELLTEIINREMEILELERRINVRVR